MEFGIFRHSIPFAKRIIFRKVEIFFESKNNLIKTITFCFQKPLFTMALELVLITYDYMELNRDRIDLLSIEERRRRRDKRFPRIS